MVAVDSYYFQGWQCNHCGKRGVGNYHAFFVHIAECAKEHVQADDYEAFADAITWSE